MKKILKNPKGEEYQVVLDTEKSWDKSLKCIFIGSKRKEKLQEITTWEELKEFQIKNGADLRYRVFCNMKFTGYDFDYANLSDISCEYSNFKNATFRKAKLRKTDLNFTNLKGAIFDGAILKNAKICSAKLENASFIEADLSSAVLWSANIKKANFDSAKLDNAEFSYVKKSGSAIFSNTIRDKENNKIINNLGVNYTVITQEDIMNLNHNYFKDKEKRFIFVGGSSKNITNISSWKKIKNYQAKNPINLDVISFDGLDLKMFKNAKLIESDFEHADLSAVSFLKTNLMGANFKNAYLGYSNLRHADLSNANFKNANLEYADLRCAKIEKCNLSKAKTLNIDNRNQDIDNILENDFNVSNLIQKKIKDPNGKLFSVIEDLPLEFLSRKDRHLVKEFFENKKDNYIFVGYLADRKVFEKIDTWENLKNHQKKNPAILRKVEISYAQLINADFENAIIYSSYFWHNNLQESNFKNSILKNVNFEGSNFKNACFKKANLGGDKFRYCTFTGGLFQYANFENADLTYVDFHKPTDYAETNLQYANFKNADLNNTNFNRAKIKGANFKNTIKEI